MSIRLGVVIVVSLGAWLAFLVGAFTCLLICFLQLTDTFVHVFVVAFVACWSYGVVGGDVDGLARVRRHRVQFICSSGIVAAEKA